MNNEFWKEIFDCGCGSQEPDEKELNEIVREAEADEEVLIPAPDVFVSKREKVLVE